MSALPKEEVNEPAWLAAVRHQVETLRFGVVQIVVHESRVVQIDRTERLRLDKAGPGMDAPPAPHLAPSAPASGAHRAQVP
jgi:hypothetical protein